MMGRFFGKKKKKDTTNAPTLDDAAKNMDRRGGEMDNKIAKLDQELLKYKKQMAKMKNGPAKRSIQQRALAILKQKKMYEKQRGALYNQQFNIDQTRFAQENLKDTATTVSAMKTANVELKAQFKEINLDEIEDLHDDMSELLEDNDEIQELMSRSYGVPDELDEDDLMDELEALDELELEEEEEEVPSYLVSAASAANANKLDSSVMEADQEKDEYGLPRVPANQLNA